MKKTNTLRKAGNAIVLLGCIGAIVTVGYSYLVKPVVHKDSILFGIAAFVLLLRFFLEEKKKRKEIWVLAVAGSLNLVMCILSIVVNFL